MTGVTFGPDEDDRYSVWRDGLVADFEGVVAASGIPVDPSDLGLLLDWKHGYADGRLGVWRRRDVEQFLLDWCPAKLSMSAADAQHLPAGVGLAMTFLAGRGLLEQAGEPAQVLARHATGLQPAFLEAMDDPSNFGMAKSLFAGLDLDVDELTPEALDAAVARHNALPEAERRARTDRVPPGMPLGDIEVGPVVLPDEQTLRAAAQASPALRTFVELGKYFRPPGRVLTKTGNLRLADARALVDLLGTGDTFRERGGDDWYGSTRSAAQLPILDHWKWWATEAGVLRKVQGRLVAVEAWRRRARQDPLRELLRALDLLADVGPLQSYRWWVTDPLTTTLDASLGPLLSRLLEAREGVGYDDLRQDWESLLRRLRVPEQFPSQVEGDFSQLVDVLERAGVVVHVDAQPVATRFGYQRRGRGSLTLSTVGLRFAVDLLTEQGVRVRLVPAPQAQTASGLVGLADDVDAEVWWPAALGWLDVQPDPTAAALDLLAELDRADEPALLPVCLEDPPQAAVERLVPALRRLAAAAPPAGDLGLLAAAWLDVRGQLQDGEVAEDAPALGTMVALGRIAVSSPETMIAALSSSDGAGDLHAFVELVVRVAPPRAVELLEALGKHHPDKGVAKAARKQLFRLRSRLAQRTADGARS